jgi:ABC-2 type transport system permease protein
VAVVGQLAIRVLGAGGGNADRAPLNAGTQIMSVAHPDPTMLGPWAGLAVTALYAAVALVAGGVVLKRHDA